MKKQNNSLRADIRKFLVFLIHKLDEQQKPKTPVLRLSTDNIFKIEVSIPPSVVMFVSFVLFYAMVFAQIGTDIMSAIGIFALLSMICIFIFFYLSAFAKPRELDTDSTVLTSFVFVCSFILFQVFNDKLSPIAFPMPAFTILLAMLVSVRMSLMYIAVMSILISAISGFSAIVPVILIAGSLVSILKIKKIDKRSRFVRIGTNCAVAMSVAVIIVFLFGFTELEEMEMDVWFAMLNSFLSVIIALAILPLLETLFSKTTNIKLVELADFNNVLLKRLMVEAPGTYHHSLMTASLAEQAADAIGANSLLARVCSYYHDIGKLKNPEYFIENQTRTYNPHDDLTPSMSGLIIASHVKDGVVLAKNHKLDKVIVDAVKQHHGTSVIQYFYNKAMKNDASTDEETFRYMGEKPKTKIAAILMLADSIEAVSRTLQDRSLGKLKEVVEKVINNKFTDGQFSDCPITLKDLVQISESMTRTLGGMYHARIDYKILKLREEK